MTTLLHRPRSFRAKVTLLGLCLGSLPNEMDRRVSIGTEIVPSLSTSGRVSQSEAPLQTLWPVTRARAAEIDSRVRSVMPGDDCVVDASSGKIR